MVEKEKHVWNLQSTIWNCEGFLSHMGSNKKQISETQTATLFRYSCGTLQKDQYSCIYHTKLNSGIICFNQFPSINCHVPRARILRALVEGVPCFHPGNSEQVTRLQAGETSLTSAIYGWLRCMFDLHDVTLCIRIVKCLILVWGSLKKLQ